MELVLLIGWLEIFNLGSFKWYIILHWLSVKKVFFDGVFGSSKSLFDLILFLIYYVNKISYIVVRVEEIRIVRIGLTRL